MKLTLPSQVKGTSIIFNDREYDDFLVEKLKDIARSNAKCIILPSWKPIEWIMNPDSVIYELIKKYWKKKRVMKMWYYDGFYLDDKEQNILGFEVINSKEDYVMEYIRSIISLMIEKKTTDYDFVELGDYDDYKEYFVVKALQLNDRVICCGGRHKYGYWFKLYVDELIKCKYRRKAYVANKLCKQK